MTVVTDGTSTMLERDTVVQEEEGENVEKEGTEDVAFSQMVDDCFFAPQPPRKLEDCVFTEMVDDCFFSGIKNPNQKLKKSWISWRIEDVLEWCTIAEVLTIQDDDEFRG